MSALRVIAAVGVACALVALVCGLTTGRRVLRDTSGCERALLVKGWIDVTRSVVNPLEAVNPVSWAARFEDKPPPCEPTIELVERPALAAEACAALAAIALAGAFVALWPRRLAAGAWIVVALAAGVIAFVLTRTFDVRSEITTLAPTWYAARIALAALAASVVAAIAWLVWASDGV